MIEWQALRVWKLVVRYCEVGGRGVSGGGGEDWVSQLEGLGCGSEAGTVRVWAELLYRQSRACSPPLHSSRAPLQSRPLQLPSHALTGGVAPLLHV